MYWPLIVAAVLFVVVLLFSIFFTVPQARDISQVAGIEGGGCVMPNQTIPQAYSVVYDNVLLRNSENQPNRVFFQQWHLAEPDSGAFTFDACGVSGGFVIYLVDVPDSKTLANSSGYAIVVGDVADQTGVPQTYITKIPGFPTRHPLSKINKGFQIPEKDSDGCKKLWVVYSHGNLSVGEGERPDIKDGKSSLVTCMTGEKENAPNGIQWFGFGTLRKESAGIQIKNIRTFDAPVSGCSWDALIPKDCPA